MRGVSRMTTSTRFRVTTVLRPNQPPVLPTALRSRVSRSRVNPETTSVSPSTTRASMSDSATTGAFTIGLTLKVTTASDEICGVTLNTTTSLRTSAGSLFIVSSRWLASVVTVPCPALDGGPGRYARWGEQLDVHNITEGGDQAGVLSAEQVAGYIAKYATKATESFGSGLDRRLTAADDLERLDQLPAHVAQLVRACWELGGRPELDGLRLRAWAHMLGFGGHWSTKSRRYSTAMGALRRARVAFAKRRRARDGIPLDAWGRPEDDQAVIVVASWAYVGAGYATEGERWLALSAAARAREQRRVAWEELRTTAA